MDSSDLSSTTEATATSGFIPPTPPDVQVLIPQNYPGAFYYPPCKCDLVNQIRYYNPKTRQFYYHNAHHPWLSTMSPIPPPPGGPINPSNKIVLAGEPETFSELSHPFYQMVPAGSGHHPYVQGPYLQPGPTIPKSPYSVPVVPSPAQFHESGICEVILVIFVFLLWLYSFYRLYLVWQKTLNFSESSIQGPQGWDLLVNWVMERIQIRELKVLNMGRKRNPAKKNTLNDQENGAVHVEEGSASAVSAGMNKESVVTEDDLDRIERCVTPSASPSRSHLKLQLLKEYDNLSRSSSGSSFPRPLPSNFHSKILYSHPCSLQILHEDEASSSHAPPPPLAAFGGIGPKLTATELRRTRMMNKQMSEDCAPARRPASSGHYDEGSRRSLQNATESCEMRDMTGRSMHDRKATTRQSIRGIKKQYSLALSDAAV